MKALLWQAYRRLLLLFAIIIVTLAVILSVLRAFSPLISGERINIEAYLSKELQQPVVIGSIEMAWRGFEPVARVHNIIFLDPKTKQPTAVINTLDLGINTGRSLLAWELKPGLVAISGLTFKVIQDKDGTFQVPAIHAIPPFKLAGGVDDRHQQILSRLFKIGRVYLKNINIDWQQFDGRIVHIKDVQLELLNTNNNHQIWGSFVLDQELPTHIDLVANIDGDLAEENTLSAKIYLKAHDLFLPQIFAHYNPYHLTITNGLAGLQVWLNWQHKRINSLQTKFQVHHLVVKQAMNPTPLSFTSLTADLNWWRDQQGGWQLTADANQIVSANKIWQPVQIYLKNPGPTEKNKNQIAYISYLDLKVFTPLIQYWPDLPPGLRKQLLQMQPQGELFDFYLKRNPLLSNTYSVTAQFNNLGFHHWNRLPTISGLSGQIIFTPQGGQMEIDSKNIRVYFPEIFDNPHYFSTLQTTLRWIKTGKNWQVQATPFSVANKDLRLHGTVKLLIPPPGQTPDINLLLSIKNLNLAHLHNYLPQRIMKSSLSEWLQKAIQGGVADQTTLLMRGPLNQFPFEQHEGVFIVKTHFQGLNLLYNPKWPVAKNLTGTVTYNGVQLKGVIEHGQLANSAITHATVEIPYLGADHPEFIIISSQQQGDLSNAMQFLREGPLRDHIGKAVSAMQLHGPMSLHLNLYIPLKKEDKDVKIQGIVTMKNATQSIPQWGIHFTGISGQLFFSEHELFARNMKALLFGQPLSFDISTVTKNAITSTQIDAHGQVNIQSLLQQFHLPAQSFVSGTTDYQAVLQLQHESNSSDSLIVTSNLKGLAIDLPSPLAKQANQSENLKINLDFNPQQPLHLTASYGNRISTAIILARQNGHLQLLSGEVRIGPQSAHIQKLPGLLISGRLAEFDWSKWLPLFDYLQRVGAHNVMTTTITKPRVDLFIDHLTLWQQEFPATRIRIVPNPHAWQLVVAGPNIAGNVWWNQDLHGNSILARLKYLYLSEKPGPDQHIQINPRVIPPLHITIDDLHYGDMSLGELKLLTSPVKDGLMIKLLSLDSPYLHFEARGDWLAEMGGGVRTRVSCALLSHDVEGLLKSWHLPTVIVGKDLKVNFLITWPDAPFNLRLGLLDGDIKIQMGEGSITNVGKKAQADISLGRMLNLLSLENLPRRLLMHFHDLTTKGFSFDSIKGDFVIHDGDAETKNVVIKGLVADIKAKGQIGLAQKDFNLRLAVTPHLTSSLPVLVALTSGPAGPVAGAITWAILKLLGPCIGELTTRYYDLTGPWHKPSVTSVDEAKKNSPFLSEPTPQIFDRMEDFLSVASEYMPNTEASERGVRSNGT